MKVQGTRAVKDEDIARINEPERTQEEDPAHHTDPPLEKRSVAVPTDQTNGESQGRRTGGVTRAGHPAFNDLECWADVKTACKNAFSGFEQSTHATSEHLCQEMWERHGEWLAHCLRPDRAQVFEKIAINVLIAAGRDRRSGLQAPTRLAAIESPGD